jgi:hypothetical protein
MRTVFLAGSIEMGKATNWQEEVSFVFDKKKFNVLNPRREDWDASWVQEFTNPQFYQQVDWELRGQEEADFILMYLAPETISPISLLETGLFADSGKLYVACPKGYARRGNVEILCSKYDIPFYSSIEGAVSRIITGV